MVNKWVDNDEYFGPDRRDRRGLRAFSERRRFDETTEPPSLAATLRRLRVLLGHPNAEDAYSRAQNLVTAAIGIAERMQISECANILRRADDKLRETPDDFDGVETIVSEAMAHI